MQKYESGLGSSQIVIQRKKRRRRPNARPVVAELAHHPLYRAVRRRVELALDLCQHVALLRPRDGPHGRTLTRLGHAPAATAVHEVATVVVVVAGACCTLASPTPSAPAAAVGAAALVVVVAVVVVLAVLE